MDTLKALHCFVRAVELGSLSAVARESGSSQPTVSKTMAALERQVGAQLLIRSTTRVQPTEQGRRFYEHARQTLESYAEGVSQARGETEQVRGRLRVSAPVSLGVLRLNALLLEFMQLHPEVEVELLLNDRFVDLVEEGIDLALRLGGELPDQLIARPLARWPARRAIWSHHPHGFRGSRRWTAPKTCRWPTTCASPGSMPERTCCCATPTVAS